MITSGSHGAAEEAAPAPTPTEAESGAGAPPGWSVEERTTATGRKYVVCRGPNGESAKSRAAMWRAAAPGASSEGAPEAPAGSGVEKALAEIRSRASAASPPPEKRPKKAKPKVWGRVRGRGSSWQLALGPKKAKAKVWRS